MIRDESKFRNGFEDGLDPLESLDLNKINDFDELLEAMSMTAFNGRRLGEAAQVLYNMILDEDCLVVGTFTGAMTVAKMGTVLCDMIDWGWLDIIVSTGALMAHGLVEAAGMTHFKYDRDMDDYELYKLGYDRVYDTLELEKNLDDVERILSEILSKHDKKMVLSSEGLCHAIGHWLANNTKKRGILKSAYLHNVPVYIPAFTDCEIGLDVSTWMVQTYMKKHPEVTLNDALQTSVISFDPFLDLSSYATRVIDSKKLGIFTIGGGVPRNWAQQVSPYLDILKLRTKSDVRIKKFHYGVRICPEFTHWGGLSGCTYSEGVSWGKFIPENEGGQFSEVYADATLAWPLLIKGVKQRLDKKNR